MCYLIIYNRDIKYLNINYTGEKLINRSENKKNNFIFNSLSYVGYKFASIINFVVSLPRSPGPQSKMASDSENESSGTEEGNFSIFRHHTCSVSSHPVTAQ
jgi:hypothetical protein